MGFMLLAPRLDTNAETEREWHSLLFNVYQYMCMEISYTYTHITEYIYICHPNK